MGQESNPHHQSLPPSATPEKQTKTQLNIGIYFFIFYFSLITNVYRYITDVYRSRHWNVESYSNRFSNKIPSEIK
jgi:hypothetical protein